MPALSMRRLVVVLLALGLLRALIAAIAPLLAAEAYYWLWSRQLAAGFHDHPPMVAVFLRAGTSLLGDTTLGVRLLSVLGATLAPFVFLAFCRRVVSESAARLAALLLGLTLVMFPFGILITPDTPLLCFWVVALLVLERALRLGGTWRWMLAGGVAGLCLLSKYTGGSLLSGVGVFLLITPSGRAQLRTLGPWLGLATCFGVFAPNLAWNAAHGASSLATPFNGLDAPELGSVLRKAAYNLTSLPVSAMVLLSPVFFVAWLRASADGWRRLWAGTASNGAVFCLCMSWVPLALFVGLALLMGVSTHWLAPCFVSALPLLAAWLTDSERPRPGWLRAGVLNCVLFLLPIVALPALVLHTDLLAPRSEDGALAKLNALLRAPAALTPRLFAEFARHPEPLLLMSQDYHLTSLLSWITGGHAALPLKRNHFRQHRIWYREGQYDGRDALYLKWVDSDDPPPRLERVFARVTELEPEVLTLGGVKVGEWRLFLCEDFAGPFD